MNRSVLVSALAIMVCALLNANTIVAEPTLELGDEARFQGIWFMAENVINGYKSTDRQIKPWVLVVEGDEYNPGAGEQSVDYSFRLDPTRTPKTIDLISREELDRGRVYRGIYAFEGESLIVCRPLDSEDERPAGFSCRPNSGLSRVVWKRKKD